jgi:hypothetical protein
MSDDGKYAGRPVKVFWGPNDDPTCDREFLLDLGNLLVRVSQWGGEGVVVSVDRDQFRWHHWTLVGEFGVRYAPGDGPRPLEVVVRVLGGGDE